ncbi:MAG: hypothetical protein HY399_05840 [Elusimicrobia bacterium]|nr:hypothetical protein [Elusimicrobiota bacterium]
MALEQADEILKEIRGQPGDLFSLDLRSALHILSSHLRFILFASLVLPLATGITLSLRSPVYKTQAVLLSIGAKSKVSFEPKILTSMDVKTIASNSKTLALLAQNPEIAQRVSARLESWESSERDPQALLNMVQGVPGPGETLLIIATHRNPQKAFELANAWANEYGKYINDLYQPFPENYTGTMLEHVKDAKDRLETAQNVSIQFARNNKSDIISMQIENLRSLLKLEPFLEKARLLRDQIKMGGNDSVETNNLSIALLKADIFSNISSNNLQLRVDSLPSATTKGKQLEDLQALIDVMTNRLKNKDQNILNQMAFLQAELEKTNTKKEDLKRMSDLATQTYQTLLQKTEELQVTTQTRTREVVLASPAPLPSEPIPTHKVLKMVVAALLGFIVSFTIAYALEFRNQ